ncbi:MAG TPA: tetratricopeptide repeat protein, partial [Deltaproteobacteria bacterium]|nr:tetratricopeptide repeat protein [Deltaproteobacteria bacterium]
EEVNRLNNMAVQYAHQGEYDKAITSLKKASSLSPEDADIYYNIACMYSRMNMVEESVAWLERAVSKGFNNWKLIKKDPDLDNIRVTGFYKKLVRSH